MNVLKRAFLYDTRKKGKSLTLFLLFALITLFVTISFSVLSATQAAATNLRETVGASFTLRGKPVEFSADEADFSMRFIPISQQDIDLIAGSTEIKVCNAQQSATATASGVILPSGMPSGTISANTSSAWNRNFTSIMQVQGYPEPNGKAKMTGGYNLPARYVLHTVGPIVQGRVTRQDREELASCYRSCLELAAEQGLSSVAFCCISTGEFHFPNQEAAEIAVKAVTEFLQHNTTIQKVIFNVFKDIDAQIYRNLLGESRAVKAGA